MSVTVQVKKTRGKVEFNRAVWNYMKKQGLTGRQLQDISIAVCPARVNKIPATLVRIFSDDGAKAKKVNIQDYESLSEYPDLILYDGYYYKNDGKEEMRIEPRNKNGISLLDKKIQDGSVTAVGVPEEKTASQKAVGALGKFMVKGGFMVVIIAVVLIVVLSGAC